MPIQTAYCLLLTLTETFVKMYFNRLCHLSRYKSNDTILFKYMWNYVVRSRKIYILRPILYDRLMLARFLIVSSAIFIAVIVWPKLNNRLDCKKICVICQAQPSWHQRDIHVITTCQPMMTSSNGNVFRVTGPLCGEFTAQRPVTQSFDVFFDLRLE